MSNTENPSTLFTVYNQRLAGYLMQQGFVLIALAPRENRKNMFLFRNTPSLHDAIGKWQTVRAENAIT